MNLNKFLNLDYLKENPLCGIDTYKDTLNLATGACTRKIKKLVFTGQESWALHSSYANLFRLNTVVDYLFIQENIIICNAYASISNRGAADVGDKQICCYFSTGSSTRTLYIKDLSYNNADDFKTYLSQQYANGTPVTVWYVLETPTTETIAVPTGLSGIIEGYLTQSGTPTPTNPVYPTANNAEGWYPFNYYIMDIATDTLPQLPSTIYPTNTYLNVELEGNSVQNGTPTPSSPVDVNGVGDESDVPTYIVNAHIDGVNIQKAFEHSELCELTAPNKPSEYFNYWKDENNNILSYNQTFTQRIAMDRNIYATYSNVEVTPQPCLEMYLYNAIKDGGNNLYWLFFGEVPDNYSVIEEGIMYTANRTAGYTQDSTVDLTTVPGFDFDAVWADSSKYRVDKYTGTGNIFTQVFNLFIGDSVNNYFYGKGYITIKNNTTQEQSTIYSDMVKGTYNNTNLRPTPTTHDNIPITCSNITYNRYLSETESIRYIKKLVLDGTENWKLSSTTNQFYIDSVLDAIPQVTPSCTHFKGVNMLSADNQIVISASQKINIRTTYIQHNLTDWINYLQQQYANGTPVTVWYVLSTPETSTINEPLMKIGNYTDKINTTIPTKGTTEITVDTTLQPSNIGVDGFQNIEIDLKGNTVQSGTPTPNSPIDVVGVGERTGNLFDKDATNTNNGYISGYYLYPDGTPIKPSSSLVWNTSEYIELTSGYIALSTLSTTSSGTPAICFYDSSKNYIIGYSYDNGEVRIHEVPSGAKYCRISIDERVINQLMLNQGSTALPYEPYGYKIPILTNSTTTNVYLGEVQTTRKIKKLVLTGEETVNIHPTIASWFQIYLTDTVIDNLELCTHYKPSPNTAATIQNGEILVGKQTASNDGRIIIRDTAYTTTEDFKSYLQQQYAAGTPVCVWYVLAEPTTGIVNEPLQKIGSYADSINNISITTTDRINTIDIPTTVQPSEVTVNYTGWHPVQNIHEYYSNYTIADMQTFTIAQLQTYTISELQEGEWL